jgi:hypothetical protein
MNFLVAITAAIAMCQRLPGCSENAFLSVITAAAWHPHLVSSAALLLMMFF